MPFVPSMVLPGARDQPGHGGDVRAPCPLVMAGWAPEARKVMSPLLWRLESARGHALPMAATDAGAGDSERRNGVALVEGLWGRPARLIDPLLLRSTHPY